MEIQHINASFSSCVRPSNESSFRNNRNKKPQNKEIICKISFQIDNQEEQLLIYDDTTIDMVTDQLITKISLANLIKHDEVIQISEEQRYSLEQQIKEKIQIIIESCPNNSQKSIKWKQKLNKIISPKQDKPSFLHSQDSSQPTNSLSCRSNTINYFGYNHCRSHKTEYSDSRNNEIIQRAKFIEHSLSKKNKTSRQNSEQKNRLYDQGKKNLQIKEYLGKIREDFLESEELSQCTFQPTMIKPFIKTDKKHQNSLKSYSEDVFSRLYNEAIEKQEKMKEIEREVHQRQEVQLNNLNFIPKIDDCSREIVKVKKQRKKANNIYDDLYHKVFNKNKHVKTQAQDTFHPKICPKSQKLAKKARAIQSQKQLFFHQKSQVFSNSKREKQTPSHLKSTKNNTGEKQNSKYLQKFDFLNQGKSNKSINLEQRNILGQLRNQLLNNRSQRLNSFESSLEKKHQNRKIETCESQNNFNRSANQLLEKRQFKNVVNLSTLENDVVEKGVNFKKTKQNLYYLVSQDSSRNQEGNISPISLSPFSKNKRHNTSQDGTFKIKKPLSSPYEFFRKQEQKEKQHETNSFVLEKSIEEQNQEKKQHLENTLENQKEELFEKIFGMFNLGQKEQLSFELISKSKLIPNNLKNVFFPMAEEMRQLNVGLDIEEFVWSLTRIYQKLSQQQRKNLLFWGLNMNMKVNESNNEQYK